MNITLDEIKAAHDGVSKLIAAFESQLPRIVTFEKVEIELRDGEQYAGIITAKDGAPAHHLILMPGEAESIKWDAAGEWATKAGGALPSRREQALLFANLQDQFQPRYYWSGEQHADSDYAWSQDFGNGNQIIIYKSYEGRARVVRRLIIL
jgi:hypothetical protein